MKTTVLLVLLVAVALAVAWFVFSRPAYPLTQADAQKYFLEDLQGKGLSKEDVEKLLKKAIREGRGAVTYVTEEFLRRTLGDEIGGGLLSDFRSATKDFLTRNRENAVLRIAEALLEEASLPDKSVEDIRLMLKDAAGMLGVILSEKRYDLLGNVMPYIQEILAAHEDDQSASLVCEPFIDLFEREEFAKDPFESYVRKRRVAMMIKALGGAAVSGLTFRLSEQTPLRLRSVIAIAGYVEEKAIVPRLAALVDHPDYSVKEELAKVLQRLGGIESVRMLISMLADANEELRDHVTAALAEMCGKDVIPELEKHLSDARAGKNIRKAIDSIKNRG